jgi:hypothetical protein
MLDMLRQPNLISIENYRCEMSPDLHGWPISIGLSAHRQRRAAMMPVAGEPQARAKFHRWWVTTGCAARRICLRHVVGGA